MTQQMGKLEAMDNSNPNADELPSLDNLQALLGRRDYDNRRNNQANSNGLLFALVPSKVRMLNSKNVCTLKMAVN